jgi:hypothetical protein
MLEILATKAALFDQYVRRSELKEISPDAGDVSSVDGRNGSRRSPRRSAESSKPNGGGSLSMHEAEVRLRRFGRRRGASATRKLHKRLHTHRTIDQQQVDLNRSEEQPRPARTARGRVDVRASFARVVLLGRQR